MYSTYQKLPYFWNIIFVSNIRIFLHLFLLQSLNSTIFGRSILRNIKDPHSIFQIFSSILPIYLITFNTLLLRICKTNSIFLSNRTTSDPNSISKISISIASSNSKFNTTKNFSYTICSHFQNHLSISTQPSSDPTTNISSF